MAIDENKWPELKQAWDDYGHGIAWKDLHAAKTDGRGNYVVVSWRTEEGLLSLADLARAGDREPWEFQNDGMSPDITDAEWRKLKIEPDCDNFYIPGHTEYKSWGGAE
jgi:hypothetical protein